MVDLFETAITQPVTQELVDVVKVINNVINSTPRPTTTTPKQMPGIISSEPAVAEDRAVDPKVSEILTAQDQDTLKTNLKEVISKPITHKTVSLKDLISLANTAKASWVQAAVEPSEAQQQQINRDLESVAEREISSEQIQNKWNQWNRDLISQGSYPIILPQIPSLPPVVSIEASIPTTAAPTTTTTPRPVIFTTTTTTGPPETGSEQETVEEEEVTFTEEQLAFMAFAPQEEAPGVISAEPAVAENRIPPTVRPTTTPRGSGGGTLPPGATPPPGGY